MKTTQILLFQYSGYGAPQLKIIQKQKKEEQVTGSSIYPSLNTKTFKRQLKTFRKTGNNKKQAIII